MSATGPAKTGHVPRSHKTATDPRPNPQNNTPQAKGPDSAPGNPVWGAALAGLAVGGIAANLALPWLSSLSFETGSYQPSSWWDMRGGDLPYEQRLLWWPLVALVATAAAGVASAVRPRPGNAQGRIAPLVPGLSAWTLAGAGLLLTLTGTRWLGFSLARAAGPGPAPVRLHVVPYMDLALGLLLLATALWFLVPTLGTASASMPARRWTIASAGTAATTLVILPLLPFAQLRVGTAPPFLLDEYTLALVAHEGHAQLRQAASALGWMRVALWSTLGLALAPLLSRHLRARPWDRFIPVAGLAAVLAGAVMLGWFYLRTADAGPGVELWPHPVPSLALLGLTALWVLCLLQVWRPARRNGSAAGRS